MSKLKDLAELAFLSEAERADIEKKAEATPALNKLLNMHDAIFDAGIRAAMVSHSEHLSYSSKQLQAAKEYSDQEEEHDVNQYDALGNVTYTEKMSRRIWMLSNKQSALPERIQSLQKTIMDSTENLLELISINNSKSSTKVKIDEKGELSAADIVAIERLGKGKKNPKKTA